MNTKYGYVHGENGRIVQSFAAMATPFGVAIGVAYANPKDKNYPKVEGRRIAAERASNAIESGYENTRDVELAYMFVDGDYKPITMYLDITVITTKRFYRDITNIFEEIPYHLISFLVKEVNKERENAE